MNQKVNGQKMPMNKEAPNRRPSHYLTPTLTEFKDLLHSIPPNELFISFDVLITQNQDKPGAKKAIEKDANKNIIGYKMIVNPRIILRLFSTQKIWHFITKEAHRFYGSSQYTTSPIGSFIPDDSDDGLTSHEDEYEADTNQEVKRSPYEDFKYTQRDLADNLRGDVLFAYAQGDRVYLAEDFLEDVFRSDNKNINISEAISDIDGIDEIVDAICYRLIGKARQKSNLNRLATKIISATNRNKGIPSPKKDMKPDKKGEPLGSPIPSNLHGLEDANEDINDNDVSHDDPTSEGDQYSSNTSRSSHKEISTPEGYWDHKEHVDLFKAGIDAIDAIAKCQGFGSTYSSKAVEVYRVVHHTTCTLEEAAEITGGIDGLLLQDEAKRNEEKPNRWISCRDFQKYEHLPEVIYFLKIYDKKPSHHQD